jgi:hypothetical protein
MTDHRQMISCDGQLIIDLNNKYFIKDETNYSQYGNCYRLWSIFDNFPNF